ncbi:MAG: 1-acyl-sn-glycerol-3-phosphate acyltransferase, partial [Planctomycetales bacterium]
SSYPARVWPIVFCNMLLTRVLWRTDVEGKISLPANSGGVIVCNHCTSVDPFFVQLVAGRIVHWFVAREYFKIPVVGSFLRSCEAIPTNRGGVDTASTKTAIRYAKSGELVGILPEGRINDTDQFLLPGRPGALMIAIKSRVPIIPCYLFDVPYDGTFWGCLFMPARVRLVVGQPLDLSQYYDQQLTSELLAELTIVVLRRIAELGGQPDYQPQVAGRRWKTGRQMTNA